MRAEQSCRNNPGSRNRTEDKMRENRSYLLNLCLSFTDSLNMDFTEPVLQEYQLQFIRVRHTEKTSQQCHIHFNLSRTNFHIHQPTTSSLTERYHPIVVTWQHCNPDMKTTIRMCVTIKKGKHLLYSLNVNAPKPLWNVDRPRKKYRILANFGNNVAVFKKMS